MKAYLLLLAIVAVSACVSSLKDCSNDRECLEAAFKDCSGAKGTIPLDENNSLYIEVRGFEGERCVIYERMDGPGVKSVLNAINNLTESSYKELSLLCKIPRDITVSLITDLSTISSYREGSLISLVGTLPTIR